jgi:NADH-quinone oxidoreductase subunit H
VIFWPSRREQPTQTLQEQVDARALGSFPLPPMDLQVPPSPRAKRTVAAREPAQVGPATDEKEV